MPNANEKIITLFSALLLGLILALYLIFDYLVAISLNPIITIAIGSIATISGLIIFRLMPMPRRIVLAGLIITGVAAISFINWNSRKPFLRAFNQVEIGMSADEVDETMADFTRLISPEAVTTEEGIVDYGIISYRHTTESWGDSDIGQVTFSEGKVINQIFYPD